MKQRLLIALAALLVASACSKKIDSEPKINDPIVGMWVVDRENTTSTGAWDFQEFRSDGTVTYGLYTPPPYERFEIENKFFMVMQNSMPVNGRYTIIIGEDLPLGAMVGVRFSDINSITMDQSTVGIHSTYRRVSDWSSLGYPDHIMEQMPQ